MTQRHSGFDDRCPYDVVSGSIAGCPRFEPRVVFERPDGAIVTCAHVRCSVDRPVSDESTASFYPRCVLRTGEIEAERAFAVPLD